MIYDWMKSNDLAMWRFDGDPYDESINAHHLKSYAPLSYSIGKFGPCANFTGLMYSYGTCMIGPDDPILSSTFSIDGWINTADNSGVQTIISIAEYFEYSGYWGWLLQIEDGVIVFGSANGSSWDLVYGLKNIADSMWHKIVITAGANIEIYLDGLLEKSSVGSSIGYPWGDPMVLSVGVLHFYDYAGVWSDKFIGQINRLEILNSVKSPQEIQRDYAFQMGWL